MLFIKNLTGLLTKTIVLLYASLNCIILRGSYKITYAINRLSSFKYIFDILNSYW